ncbi:MAG: bifunctional oligoribonuclease/PAP phosphatase NrnA [Deltaproteobacteria bacterium]|nr:bifunctional oligoribonuclease/PAP phosphatase NrnA [Deltaproteobacteria bacterium]
MKTQPAIRLKAIEDEKRLFERLKNLISSHQKFLLTTHLLPDGDGLGGEIALAAYIRSLGKKCTIMNVDPTPEKFSLVDVDHEIQIWDATQALPTVDVVLALDVNELERLGAISEAIAKLKVPVIFIDHHLSQNELKSLHIIDEEISSMGELIYRFLEYTGVEINFKMALALYVSIFTDTNVFRHRKITALSHQICASLVEVGVKPHEVFRQVHQTKSLNDMHLLGEVLSQVKTTFDGKIAWVEVSQALQRTYRACAEDTQAFVDYLLILKDVEVGLMFREEKDQRIKISFRSKGSIHIYPLVKKLGGGGHQFEAGVLKKGPMAQVVHEVLLQVQKLFN